MIDAKQIFGNIDIYLFDQILKDRFLPNSKILDVGCGGGRNLVYFLQNDFDVYAVDPNPEVVQIVKNLAHHFAPNLSQDNFQVSNAEKMPFESDYFDTIICSAVLHFAENEDHFYSMFDEMWRVLKKGGIFFARLASTIGIENKIQQIDDGRFLLPDSSEPFWVEEEVLRSRTEKVGGTFLEPIKTTNVQNLRCMTTWILQKS
ncbi:MAG: class I SAM-dependent methyltransferase [Aridibacter sp.]